MSRSKDRHEARRGLDTAAEDLCAARGVAEAGLHTHTCFTAQQTAEKAVKATWYLIGEAPGDHSVQRLLTVLPLKEEREPLLLVDLLDFARMLDRLYVPTRYPNGLPDLTPEKNFTEAASRQAIEMTERFLQTFTYLVDAWQ